MSDIVASVDIIGDIAPYKSPDSMVNAGASANSADDFPSLLPSVPSNPSPSNPTP